MNGIGLNRLGGDDIGSRGSLFLPPTLPGPETGRASPSLVRNPGSPPFSEVSGDGAQLSKRKRRTFSVSDDVTYSKKKYTK